MTIAGATVSSNCDVLSGLVVHQLANPGAPFIYGVCIPPIDMHTTIEYLRGTGTFPGGPGEHPTSTALRLAHLGICG